MVDFRYLGGRREFFATREDAEGEREQRLLDVKNHGISAMSMSLAARLELIQAGERGIKAGSSTRGDYRFP